ncbi:Anthranilate synthase [Denitrovibrio acetiphilus DSM 12809]|uniref:Anthranilate synthase n=1 Tax=Denitrovibrio acetiphilus (strain DSM 12809 / NBRC 114555 / N2460) TaxID=522772 RepID=D4H7E5_DENA2|nr:anthranilate synthase component I family protein [Denitrovibrio acetiphilus]ADD67944.1 Anthranilate synthase [Denitrovibrio acetiphilus DSM 12809]
MNLTEQIHPSRERFTELAGEFDRVTVYREIIGDTFTPITLLRNFSNEENIFLLESANLDKTFSRFSFFGNKPKRVITFQNGQVTVKKGSKKETFSMNPMDYMSQQLYAEKGYNDGTFGDFSGGFAGFFAYEAVNYMDTLRKPLKVSPESKLIGFMEVDEFYVFDNHFSKMYAAVSVQTKGGESAYDKALKRTQKMSSEVHRFNFDNYDSDLDCELVTDMTEEEYMATVDALKEEITNGEGIQIVPSNAHRLKGKINPLSLYRALRNVNPSPYMFYLKFGSEVLLGASPEIHLKIREGYATLKPIAGTYPITDDIEASKQALLSDPKERSEHLMLLDLARNDLYTCCEPESVKVKEQFVPEVYSHVIHIVSEVEGKIENGYNPLNLFMKSFPAGTVSGAPKVRAMELIEQYEKSERGFYAGCVGYFGYSGNMDTCITIRSAYVTETETVFRSGGGVIYDSDPQTEYKETKNKLGALFSAYKNIGVTEGRDVSNG